MKNEWRHADIRPEAGCTRGTDSGRTAGGRPENPVNIPETDLSWRIASVSGRLWELGKTPELPDPWGHFFAVLSDVFLSGGSEEGFLAFSACRNLFGRTAGEAACVLALLARQAADFHRAGTPEGETAWCDLCEMAVFLHGELAGGIPAGRLREEIAAFAADCLTEIAAALVRPDVIRRPAAGGIFLVLEDDLPEGLRASHRGDYAYVLDAQYVSLYEHALAEAFSSGSVSAGRAEMFSRLLRAEADAADTGLQPTRTQRQLLRFLAGKVSSAGAAEAGEKFSAQNGRQQ